MKFYSSLLVVFLVLFGFAYWSSKDKSDQEFLTEGETSLPLEEVEVCVDITNSADQYVTRGQIEFVVKEEVTEEELVAGLQSSGLALDVEVGGWQLDLTEDNQLYFTYEEQDGSKVTEVLSTFFEELDAFIEEEDELSFGGIRGTATFFRPLSESEKEFVDKELDQHMSEGLISEYGWNNFPPDLIANVYIPEGEEESYIKKFKKTGLFSCVGYSVVLRPTMPGPF